MSDGSESDDPPQLLSPSGSPHSNPPQLLSPPGSPRSPKGFPVSSCWDTQSDLVNCKWRKARIKKLNKKCRKARASLKKDEGKVLATSKLLNFSNEIDVLLTGEAAIVPLSKISRGNK